MSTRVVSKRTKLLFIGFGAVGIAAVCIVWTIPPAAKASATSTTANQVMPALAQPSK